MAYTNLYDATINDYTANNSYNAFSYQQQMQAAGFLSYNTMTIEEGTNRETEIQTLLLCEEEGL